MRISINTQYNVSEKNLRKVLRFLNKELYLTIDCLIVHILSDNAILEINNKYLNHDFYTDIITFDLRDNFSNNVELYLSFERIKENASQHSVSFEHELFRVLIHGMLHLHGQGDKTSSEKKIMRQKENYYLDNLFHVKP